MDAFSVNVRHEGEWWVVTSDDLPGLVTQGRTPKEALEMAGDAIHELAVR